MINLFEINFVTGSSFTEEDTLQSRPKISRRFFLRKAHGNLLPVREDTY